MSAKPNRTSPRLRLPTTSTATNVPTARGTARVMRTTRATTAGGKPSSAAPRTSTVTGLRTTVTGSRTSTIASRANTVTSRTHTTASRTSNTASSRNTAASLATAPNARSSNKVNRWLLEIPECQPFSESTNNSFSSSMFATTEFYCPICLSNCKKESKRTFATSCGHVFCFSCLNEAYMKKPLCPICQRTVLKQDFREIFF